MRHLLQVFVDFVAVVAGIRHHDVAILGEGQPLGPMEGVRQSVHERKEGAPGVEHLDATVAPVRNDDVVVLVHRYPGGGVELPVPLPVVAEGEQELSAGVEDLDAVVVEVCGHDVVLAVDGNEMRPGEVEVREAPVAEL